jgi:hypothetical protein
MTNLIKPEEKKEKTTSVLKKIENFEMIRVDIIKSRESLVTHNVKSMNEPEIKGIITVVQQNCHHFMVLIKRFFFQPLHGHLLNYYLSTPIKMSSKQPSSSKTPKLNNLSPISPQASE